MRCIVYIDARKNQAGLAPIRMWREKTEWINRRKTFFFNFYLFFFSGRRRHFEERNAHDQPSESSKQLILIRTIFLLLLFLLLLFGISIIFNFLGIFLFLFFSVRLSAGPIMLMKRRITFRSTERNSFCFHNQRNEEIKIDTKIQK
jgi:fatty acid desaturase